jgi:hypothetical protein
MADIDAVRVDNFKEALRQANRYLAWGLFSSGLLFALNLDPTAFAGKAMVSLPLGLPALPIGHAQIALTLVYWASPFLADFSLARAERIAAQLQKSNQELLKAAVTFPCIPTMRVHGARYVATLFPPLLVAVAGWKNGVFALSPKGIALLFISTAPYLLLLALRLRRSFGDLGPDAYGD